MEEVYLADARATSARKKEILGRKAKYNLEDMYKRIFADQLEK